MPSDVQVVPPLRVMNAPTSVPAYSVFGNDGIDDQRVDRRVRQVRCEMSSHFLPPSFVRKTWPGCFGVAALKPLYATYAIR